MREQSCILPLKHFQNQSEIECSFGVVSGSLEELINECWPWLSFEDKAYLENCHNTRKQSFLAGRKAAHIASQKASLSPITQIHYGVLGYPLVKGYQKQISIAHSGGLGAALLYPPEIKVGIDLEFHSEQTDSLPNTLFLNKDETDLLKLLSSDVAFGKLLLWTAKESLSKALQCGLNASFESLSVENVIILKDFIFKIDFTHFHSFHCYSWVFKDLCFSITLPKDFSILSLEVISQSFEKCSKINGMYTSALKRTC